MLDILAYPHLLDWIVYNAPYESLLTLRSANRSLRDRVDAILSRHLVISNPYRAVPENGETLADVLEGESTVPATMPDMFGRESRVSVSVVHGARHPALLDWPVARAQGLYNWRDDTTSDNPALQRCFKNTRILDVVGLVPDLAVSGLYSKLPPDIVMRFRADEDGRWPLAEALTLTSSHLVEVWPSPPSHIVWLGDMRASARKVECLNLPFRRGPTQATYSFIYDCQIPSETSMVLLSPLPAQLVVVFYPEYPLTNLKSNDAHQLTSLHQDFQGYTFNHLLFPIIDGWSDGERQSYTFVGLERIPLAWLGGIWAENAAQEGIEANDCSKDCGLQRVSVAIHFWIDYWMPKVARVTSEAEIKALSSGLFDSISLVTLEEYRASCPEDEYALVTLDNLAAS